MIEFINEQIRGEFHLLPIEKQQEWLEFAEGQARHGFFVTILYIENNTNTLEVSIRIGRKFNHTA